MGEKDDYDSIQIWPRIAMFGCHDSEGNYIGRESVPPNLDAAWFATVTDLMIPMVSWHFQASRRSQD